MIPHEQRGYEKVESLKREEIHAHFHKRDEQMRSSLESPLSGCFPDVGFFFFFLFLNFVDGGALVFYRNGQMVGPRPEGPPMSAQVPRPPALRGGPFPQTGAQASDCTLSPHPRLLPCWEMVLLTPVCGDQRVLGPCKLPATPGASGALISLH